MSNCSCESCFARRAEMVADVDVAGLVEEAYRKGKEDGAKEEREECAVIAEGIQHWAYGDCSDSIADTIRSRTKDTP